MFGIENYAGFLFAGILVNLLPGSDTMYILTRSIAQGKKAGIVSVLGISTGCVIHTMFAAFGLSAILMSSATAFHVIKYLGAGYLAYLGIRMLLERAPLFETSERGLQRDDLLKIYRQGMLTNVLNPKVALFFLSFLPQFVRPEQADGALPFLILGGTFATTGTLWCLFLAYSASLMTRALRNNQSIGKILQKGSGLVFVGLGVQLAVKTD